MAHRRTFALLALVLAAAGCGHSVKGICSDLEDECSGVIYKECLADGAALEQLVDRSDCSDLFDDYLDCVASASCGWAGACTGAKAALVACTGPFPR